MTDLTHALISLYPDSKWNLTGDQYSGLEWLPDNDKPKPSREELEQEVSRLKVDYQTKEYQRLRAKEYPEVKDQLDMLYHDIKNDNLSDGNWIKTIEEVKSKYPK